MLLDTLEDVIGTIGSEYASPAAIRLALRLLYAAYVICPDLSDAFLWPNDGYARDRITAATLLITMYSPPPAVFFPPLHAYIHRTSESFNSEGRLADAMAVALFAVLSQFKIFEKRV